MLKAFWTNDTTAHVDHQIDAVAEEMVRVGVMNDKYPDLVKRMSELTEIKAKGNRKIPISKDTLLIVGGMLLQTVIVVLAEDRHILNSKALQIIRPKGNGTFS
jgi:hypothetical protein